MQKSGRILADFTLVTHQSNGVVGFCGSQNISPIGIEYQPATNVGTSQRDARFVGIVLCYFSDRLVGGPNPDLPAGPFDPTRTERVEVSISFLPSTGLSVSLTLLDHGNATVEFDVECRDGVMVGDGTAMDGGPDIALYSVALFNPRVLKLG